MDYLAPIKRKRIIGVFILLCAIIITIDAYLALITIFFDTITLNLTEVIAFGENPLILTSYYARNSFKFNWYIYRCLVLSKLTFTLQLESFVFRLFASMLLEKILSDYRIKRNENYGSLHKYCIQRLQVIYQRSKRNTLLIGDMLFYKQSGIIDVVLVVNPDALLQARKEREFKKLASIMLGRSLFESSQLSNARQCSALLTLAKVVGNPTTTMSSNIESLIENVYVRKTIHNSLKCDKVALFLVDEINQNIWCKSSDDVAEIRLPLNKDIIGGSISRNARFNQRIDQMKNYKTKTVLCVRIICESKIVGAT